MLDRFAGAVRTAWPPSPYTGLFPPYWATERGRHLLSRYPVLSALVAAPLTAPQVWALDRWRPGWDVAPTSTWWHARRMAKTTAACLTALLGVAFLELLRAAGLQFLLWPTLVTMLGSPLWTVASQALWQHTVAPLALTTAWWLLVRSPAAPAALSTAGLATGMLIAARLPDAPLAAALAVVALRLAGARAFAWFLSPALGVIGIVLAYNLRVFGSVLGGQAELEALHGVAHAVAGSWGDPIGGGSGTLLSPNRGLFIFCPWVALTLALLPLTWASQSRPRGLGHLLLGVAAFGVINASYAVWWGGWSFGPRFWTDVMPVFGVLFAVTWQTALRFRPLLAATALMAIALQALGAWCYPSTWNGAPVSVDYAHARLWDWRDSEVTRMLHEGPRPREFSPLPF